MTLFTPQERGIIIFLVCALALGSAVKLFQLSRPAELPSVDDSELATFRALSDSIKQITEDQESGQAPELESLGLININAASETDLQTLPRVGPVLAKRIVTYRERHGAFLNKESLKQVKGIGDVTFTRIEPYISLE